MPTFPFRSLYGRGCPSAAAAAAAEPAVNTPADSHFLRFLEGGIARGGFETDDVLAALLPLMKQVLAAHQAGLVAPLNGIQDLLIAAEGHLMFLPTKASPPA